MAVAAMAVAVMAAVTPASAEAMAVGIFTAAAAVTMDAILMAGDITAEATEEDITGVVGAVATGAATGEDGRGGDMDGAIPTITHTIPTPRTPTTGLPGVR